MSIGTIALLIAGLVGLVAGAEALVRGAARLAARTGMSSVVIGLTVVAFGTSAPELAVSVGDALRGGPEAGSIAIGNVVGSNIANILLVLGTASAVGGALFVAQRIVRLDVPIMIGASVLLLVFVLNEKLGRIEGVVLLSLLAVYLTWTVMAATRGSAPDIVNEYEEALDPEALAKASVLSDIGFLILGLVLLVFGSQALVNSASDIAADLGVSDLVIGLTVVAIGTSLPEVATSVLAAFRGRARPGRRQRHRLEPVQPVGSTRRHRGRLPERHSRGCERCAGGHPRDGRRGRGLPSDLRERLRAQPVGGHRLPAGVRGLPHVGGARRHRQRLARHLRRRGAVLRGTDRDDHHRHPLVPGTHQRTLSRASLSSGQDWAWRATRAAPAIPALFAIAAGTIGVSIETSGSHVCADLDAPPPTMNRSGENNISTCRR